MQVLYVILYLLSAVCFLASAARVNTPKVNLLSLGLLLWVLVTLISTARHI